MTRTDLTGSRTAVFLRSGRRIVLLALLALAIVPAGVAKADNFIYPGGFDAGHIFCSPGTVDVWSPVIVAQADGESVAFADQLFRWNGSQWQLVNTTAMAYQTQYTDIFTQATDPMYHRWIANGRAWNGEWYFSGLAHGSYAVRQFLYWGGAGGHAAKSTTTWATIGWTTTTYCAI
jgi:hypothetical protein